MTPATDFSAASREFIEDQIRQLDAERGNLEKALAALGGKAPAKRGPGRPRGSRSSAGKRRSSGRRPGRQSAPRRDQALRLIKANPGIRPSELAKQMGVAAPYIYRVVPPLIDEGKVIKEGKGFVAS